MMDITLGTWRFTVQREQRHDIAVKYDHAAEKWDMRLQRMGIVRGYEKLFAGLEDAGSLRGIPKAAKVLDCGAGTGLLSQALMPYLGEGSSITMMDISAGMLAQAARKASGKDHTVTLRRGDVRRLPDADGTYDVVMAANVLEHLADVTAALKEMRRVLKPQGMLLVLATRRDLFGSLLRRREEKEPQTPDELSSALDDAGFIGQSMLRLPVPLNGLSAGFLATRAADIPVTREVTTPKTRPEPLEILSSMF